MFFSVITKNLTLEILTKNLVTFKRQDRVKNEKILILRGFTEKSGVYWGSQKANIQGGIA